MKLSWISLDSHNAHTGESVIAKVQVINSRPIAIIYNVDDSNMIRTMALEEAGFKLSNQGVWVAPIDIMDFSALYIAFPLMEYKDSIEPISNVVEESTGPNSFLSTLFNNTSVINYTPSLIARLYDDVLPPAGEALYDWVDVHAKEIANNQYEAPYTEGTNVTLSFDKSSRSVRALFHATTFHDDVQALFKAERAELIQESGQPFIHNDYVFIEITENLFAPSTYKDGQIIGIPSLARESPQEVLRRIDQETLKELFSAAEFKQSLENDTEEKIDLSALEIEAIIDGLELQNEPETADPMSSALAEETVLENEVIIEEIEPTSEQEGVAPVKEPEPTQEQIKDFVLKKSNILPFKTPNDSNRFNDDVFADEELMPQWADGPELDDLEAYPPPRASLHSVDSTEYKNNADLRKQDELFIQLSQNLKSYQFKKASSSMAGFQALTKVGLSDAHLNIYKDNDKYSFYLDVSTEFESDQSIFEIGNESPEEFATIAKAIEAQLSTYEVQVKLDQLPNYGSLLNSGENGEKLYNTTQINKRIREDFKKYQKQGVIPEGIKIGVKAGGPSSINITIKELPESIELFNPAFIEHELKNPNDFYSNSPSRYTRDYSAVKLAIEAIADAYNFDESDPMTDYFYTNFYLNVNSADSLEQNHKEKTVMAVKSKLLVSEDDDDMATSHKIDKLIGLATGFDDLGIIDRLNSVKDNLLNKSFDIGSEAILNNIEVSLMKREKQEKINGNSARRIDSLRSNDHGSIIGRNENRIKATGSVKAVPNIEQSNDFEKGKFDDGGIRNTESPANTNPLPGDSQLPQREEPIREEDNNSANSSDSLIESDDVATAVSVPIRNVDFFPRTAIETSLNSGNATVVQDFNTALKLYIAIINNEKEADTLTLDEKNLLASLAGSSHPKITESFTRLSQHNHNPLKVTFRTFSEKHPEDFKSLQESTVDAYYTPVDTIDFMWSALEIMGAKDSKKPLNILEPSVGSGRFIGLAPAAIRNTANITGIEKDAFTSKIAQLLYPETKIVNSALENLPLIASSQDIVIGNPPYGDIHIYSKDDKRKYLVHDYFISKSIRLLKPGGILAFVTSSGTMDKTDGKIRTEIQQSSDLVSAFRLPSSVFKEAGTNVVTDILFFRKRTPEEEPKNDNWLRLGPISIYDDSLQEENSVHINQYYLDNPSHILGNMQWISSQYGRKVTVEGSLTKQDYTGLLNRVPENLLSTDSNSGLLIKPDLSETIEASQSLTKIGSYVFNDKGVFINSVDGLVPHTINDKKSDKLKKIIAIRDSLLKLLDSESQGYNESSTHERTVLNKLYDWFVEEHGYINLNSNKNLLTLDPDHYLVLALEIKGQEQNVYHKADVFTTAFQQIITHEESIESVHDAALYSLNLSGYVDAEFIAGKLNLTKSEVDTQLEDNFFIDPANGKWELKAIYLSGNIYEKIDIAKRALVFNPSYSRNIEALEASIPEPILIDDINIRIGSSWIPESMVLSFLMHKLGSRAIEDRIKVDYEPLSHTWKVELTATARRDYQRRNLNELGAGGLRYDDIFARTLNYKQISIKDKEGVYDPQATTLAREKQKEIIRDFQEYILERPDYSKRIADNYNSVFNAYKEADFDGQYLTFPGMSSTFKGKPLALRKHQPAVVERILHSDSGVLIAHEAGAGKTIEMIVSAIELKRTNQAKKPLLVMPNHMLIDGTIEALNLYPNAKILTATPQDFNETGRKLFANKVRLNNWDLVICTHSMFMKISLPKDFLINHTQEQVNEFGIALQEANDKLTIKSLETAKKKLDTKLKALVDSLEDHSDAICFAECGFDTVFYDEGHYLKNFAPPSTLSSVAGVNSSSSVRATDAIMKSDFIRAIRDDNRGFYPATGTPITNSISEIWVMMRLTAPHILKEASIYNFDNFVSTFGEIVDHIELKPEGSSYQLKSRLSKFHNVPELIRLFRMVADIKTAEDLNLPTPKANDQFHTAPQSEEMKLFMSWLTHRATLVRDNKVLPTEDNILKIANDGRMASLDLRLIHPDLPDHPESKINGIVDYVHNKYIEHSEDRRTQVIFMDRGTPKKEFNLYDDMKDKWVKLGIPEHEIQFVHSAKNDKQKADLFAQVREGKVRILLGSTDKLGVGTNIQTRGSDLTNADIPWRPTDLIQRRKRFERQGNLFNDVNINFNTTEDSFDLFMLETNIRKLKFITQALSSPDKAARKLDEDVDPTLAEIMAITSGNPLIKEKVETDARVEHLSLMKRSFDSKKRQTEADSKWITTKTLPVYLDQLDKIDETLKIIPSDEQFQIEVNGQSFGIKDLKIAGLAIHEFLKNKMAADHDVALINGVPLRSGIAADRYFLELQSPKPISVNLTKDPARFLKNIINKVGNLNDAREITEEKIQECRAKLIENSDNIKAKFADAEELQTLLARQAELNVEVAKLDAERPQIEDGFEHPFEKLLSSLEAKKELLSEDEVFMYSEALNQSNINPELGM